MSTKMNNDAASVWKIARLQRAQSFPKYANRANAADDAFMSESTLAAIETGDRMPAPGEALILSEIYKEPELKCIFCHDFCPLGQDKPKVEGGSLEHIAIKTYTVLKHTSEIKDSLMEIVADGKITEDEKPTMAKILQSLDAVAQVTQDLKIAVQKIDIEENRYGG